MCHKYIRLPQDYVFTLKQKPRWPLHENIGGHIERKGGYQAEEGEKTETRRRTVRVGDRGGNCARREKKKVGGEHFREETLQK